MKSFPEGFSHMRNKQFLHFFLKIDQQNTPKVKRKKRSEDLLLIATKIWSLKKGKK